MAYKQAFKVDSPQYVLQSSDLKFMRDVSSAHRAFKNIFTGGAEHRMMMLPEANAALLDLVCLWAAVSKSVAQHASCQWSPGTILNAENLKDDMSAVCSESLKQWKKQVGLERGTNSLFPRTSLAQKGKYRAAIQEEKTLMEMILEYSDYHSKLQRGPMTDFKLKAQALWSEAYCKGIAFQAAGVAAFLSGLVDERLPKSIKKRLTVAIFNCRRGATVSVATMEQKKSILNRLQYTHKFASNVVMELGNCNVYVISYDTGNYCGFIFVDSPVHDSAKTHSRKAKIAYIETLPGHRRSALAKRMIQWVYHTAKENGYQSLYATSMLPSELFWVKCGFSVERQMAVYNIDSMCIENLLSNSSV